MIILDVTIDLPDYGKDREFIWNWPVILILLCIHDVCLFVCLFVLL